MAVFVVLPANACGSDWCLRSAGTQYEKDTIWLAAAGLYAIAKVLSVEVSYFFEALQSAAATLSPARRMLADWMWLPQMGDRSI
jgi:hypothetical protein